MEFENLLTLIKTVSDSDLTDFAYEENGTSIHLKKKKETVVVTGNSSNVPVDFCSVKFVKKPNGAKPGMVIYTSQQTLYVNPAKH